MTMLNFIGPLRRARGMSQADLAAAVGVSAGTVSRWEAGRMDCRRDHLEALAGALGVGVDELVVDEAVQALMGISAEEQALLAAYRTLSERDRSTVRGLVDLLRVGAPRGTPGVSSSRREP